MSTSRSILSRVVVPTCLAVAAGQARAQTPDLIPLPDPPAARVVPRSAPTPARVAAVPGRPRAKPCTPGHCSCRPGFSRRRCRRRLQEAFLGYPEEFERPPLGAMLYAANNAQVGNAEGAAMILQPYDFEPGTARFNRRGQDRLAWIASRLPTTFHRVIVERTELPALDESRRAAVIEALAAGPFPAPPERVVIGPPISWGLQGEDAELVQARALDRFSQGGPPLVGASTSSALAAPGSR